MNKVGLWQVIGKKLERIEESEVDLEQLLEAWIQCDPC
jgi:hypothetical protein